MIELKKRSYNLAKKEFDKGNNIWFIEQKDCPDTQEIVIIKWMKKDSVEKMKMEYKTYYPNDKSFAISDYTTDWNDWNFEQFGFFSLNKDEAQPYIKEMIVESLNKA